MRVRSTVDGATGAAGVRPRLDQLHDWQRERCRERHRPGELQQIISSFTYRTPEPQEDGVEFAFDARGANYPGGVRQNRLSVYDGSVRLFDDRGIFTIEHRPRTRRYGLSALSNVTRHYSVLCTIDRTDDGQIVDQRLLAGVTIRF